MITDRVLFIIGDRNQHHAAWENLVRTIKDQYRGEFTVCDLVSQNSFSKEEKKYLENTFSSGYTGIEFGEHGFYFGKGVWRYEKSSCDHKEITRDILMLLNNGRVPIGETVYTSDQALITNIFSDWFNSMDSEMQRLYETKFSVREFVLYVSANLKSRLGDSCSFNFDFLKAFMEAKSDFHAKKLTEIILEVETLYP